MLTTLTQLNLDHLPGTLLYLSQSVAYATAYWAARGGHHAPCTVYLASSLIHLVLGVIFLAPFG